MAKKIIAFVLVVSLTAAIAIGGTLAYLTDRDSEANVFTTGDVNIDLNEDFEQGSTLIPGVDIEKKPTVTNAGPNEAWVWTTVAVPKNLASVIDFDASGEGWMAWTEDTATIDNEEYVLYTILHEEALAVGDETTALFTKVTLDKTVDIDPDGQWHTVVGGTATDLGWNNADGNPVIHVSAYAVQKEGFADVEAAYAAYQTQWGDQGEEYDEPAEILDTTEELVAAAKNGGKYILGDNITFTDKSEFYYSNYVCCIFKDMSLDLNGYSITVDVPCDKPQNAAVLFYVYSEGASLTIEGDGDLISKNDAFLIFPRGVSEGVYIYGGNFYNNDDTSGTKNDINAIVYSQTNDNIHIYGGKFDFKNVNGHCGGFNVYDNSGAEIVLHEGVLLSNSNYYKGSDADEIHLAEGCELEESVIDGETWYQVVKK